MPTTVTFRRQVDELLEEVVINNLKVLVVDDDECFRRLLERQLTNAGYAVAIAADGNEALRVIFDQGAQIVITDWMMSGMDGLALCRAIRESEVTGFIYTIVATALSDKDRVIDAFEAGADDFITKPVHVQELLARLKAGTRILTLEADLARQNRAVHKANAELALLANKLERMATTDELTGLANRRECLTRMADDWVVSVRRRQPFSCLMLDLDHFKRVNDTYGHDTGDEVLKYVATVLRRAARAGETVCRIGGEEFVVLCPLVALDEASKAAERLRAAVEAAPMSLAQGRLPLTLSIGVAERTEEMQTHEDLLNAADVALYEAKRSGRNCVRAAQLEPVVVGA